MAIFGDPDSTYSKTSSYYSAVMAFQSRAVWLPEFYLLRRGGGGAITFLKGVDRLEWSKRLLQGGSQLVLSIHINQVLF